MKATHPEVVGLCDNFKFPGPGQRLTPEGLRKGDLIVPGLA